MADWAVGQEVRHPKFGPGSVKDVIEGGEKLRIYFPSIGTAKVILASFLEGKSGSGAPPAKVAPKTSVASLGDAERRLRLTLECLRQGLPPSGGLQKWTVGLDDVRSCVGAAFHDAATKARGRVLVVEGTYGQGKSHVGRWAQEVALSRGLAFMHAEIDGGGTSLTNSSRLLAQLLGSLVLPTGNGSGEPIPGLGTLLRRVGPRSARSVPAACSAFVPFLEHANDWANNEEAIEILEGYLASELATSKAQMRLRDLGVPMPLPALKMNYGRLPERLVAQAEQLARVVTLTGICGARGALVVVDELDHDFAAVNSQKLERAMDTLRSWSRVLAKYPIVVLLLAPPGLPSWEGIRRLKLPLLSRKELSVLTSNVVETFRQVRPDLSVDDGVGMLFTRLLQDFNSRFEDEGWGPRYFVRATVEACERAVEKQVPLKAVPLD